MVMDANVFGGYVAPLGNPSPGPSRSRVVGSEEHGPSQSFSGGRPVPFCSGWIRSVARPLSTSGHENTSRKWVAGTSTYALATGTPCGLAAYWPCGAYPSIDGFAGSGRWSRWSPVKTVSPTASAATTTAASTEPPARRRRLTVATREWTSARRSPAVTSSTSCACCSSTSRSALLIRTPSLR